MKRIEDIEKLTLEDLERLSDDESVAVPESLGKGIENRILASEILRHDSPRPSMRLWKRIVPVFAAAAVIAVVAIGLGLHRSSVTPVDTFDSPEKAYAQVERTFAMIGSKVGKGKSIADAALPHMQKTSKLIGHKPSTPPSSSEGNIYSE